MRAGQRLELLTDGGGGRAADARVDLVEDHGRRVRAQDSRQRQHHPRQLAARGDFTEAAQLLAAVGVEANLDVLRAVNALADRLERELEAGFGHPQIADNPLELRRDPLGGAATGFAQVSAAGLERVAQRF